MNSFMTIQYAEVNTNWFLAICSLETQEQIFILSWD